MSYAKKRESIEGRTLDKKHKLNIGQEAMWHIPKMQRARALRAAAWVLFSLFPLVIVVLLDFASQALKLGIDFFGFWQIMLYATPLMIAVAFLKSLFEMLGREKILFIAIFFLFIVLSVVTLGLFLVFVLYQYKKLAVYFDKHKNEEAAHLGLRALRNELKDWKCFLPKQADLASHSRVLLSPENKYFLLCILQGVLEEEYIEQHVTWEGPSIDDISKVKSATKLDKRVLWIMEPEGLEENQAVKMRSGVIQVVLDHEGMAQQIEEWNQMLCNQEHTDNDSASQYGLKVEREASQALEELLSDTWEFRRNVILANGGDADIVVTSPTKKVFVIDIKARQDQMDLEAPKGDKAKSWSEIYSQVRLAASQFQATGIVWQPTTSDQDMKRIKEIYSVRGNASTLFLSLERISQDLEDDLMVS